MTQPDRVHLAERAFRDLFRFVHSVDQEVTGILRTDDLNAAQFQVLAAIAENPGTSQAQLVRERGVTPGAMSLLTAKLEAAGLVRRDADGARHRLQLTDRGREIAARHVPEQRRYFEEMFAGLTDDELAQLTDVAARLVAARRGGPPRP